MTKNIIISSDALSFLSFKVCSSSIAFNPKEVAPFPAPNIFSIMFIIIAFVSLAFISFIGFEKIDSILFNKFRYDNASYDSRFGSIFVNIELFKNKPIFGNGFTYFETNFSNYASIVGYGKAHNTNTYFKVLSVHGAFYFLILLFGAFNLFNKNIKNLLIKIIAFIIFLIVLSNEDLMVNTLIYVISFYGYFYVKNTKDSYLIRQNIVRG